MEIKGNSRKRLAIMVVIADVLMIILAIMAVWMRGINNLNPIYLVDIGMELVAMSVGLVVLICCYVDYRHTGVDQRYYRYLLEVIIIGLFTELIAWVVNEVPSMWQINFLINVIYYMTIPFTAYYFWKYLSHLVGGLDPLIKPMNRVVVVLIYVMLALCVGNIFGGILFNVDRNGIYQRGALYPLFMTCNFVVVIAILIFMFLRRKSLSRHQILVLTFYLLAPVPSILSSIFVYGLSINYIILMLDTVVMYCVLNVEQGREKLAEQREISMARRIQEAMLPMIYPAFPEKSEFDLYATMIPTKEVGGDFYDFFMIDEDHLGLVIADVSDKGIPAAMCMMATKIILAYNLKSGKSPEEALFDANNTFCSHNAEEMFVTAWVGKLQLSTGKLCCANAGHEYPILKHGGDSFFLFEDTHGKPIGWMEDSIYEKYEISLSPEDIIFVYTDGVVEAKDKTGQMYGADRTITVLNSLLETNPKSLLLGVWDDLQEFSKDAKQFDDVTMLSLKYKGGSV